MTSKKKGKSAKNEIAIFCYKSMPVRTFEIDGEIWFVAADVADILEMRDAFNATRELDEDEKGTQKVSTPGGVQDKIIVSEAGLYTLLMRSNKPEAKPFRRWVTHEVLPSIRKTGSYALPKAKKGRKPEVCLPSGSVELAERIIRLARCAKTDEEFEEVAAMDNLFKDFTGKSALRAAGMLIMPIPQIDSVDRVYNLVTTEVSYHYKLMGSPLPPLPKSWTDEQTIDD